MAILVKETRNSAHWYTREGVAMHEVRRATPGPAGEEMRATTLGDAKLLNLLPSVTGILNIFAKPQLVKWQIKEAIFASLKLPKQEQESDDYYAKRVMETAGQQVEDAADLGIDVHKNLDMVITDGTTERCDPEIVPYVAPVIDWFRTRPFEIIHREKIIVNLQDGFAGTFDIAARFQAPDGGEAFVVIDYKTRKSKPGKEILPYDYQSWQIAAYAKTEFPDAFTSGRVYGINLYVSSTEPGRIHHVRYLPDQLINDYNCYRAASMIWRSLNDYDPRKDVVLTEEQKTKASELIAPPSNVLPFAPAAPVQAPEVSGPPTWAGPETTPAPVQGASGWEGVPVAQQPVSVSTQGPVQVQPLAAIIAPPAVSVPLPVPTPQPEPVKEKKTRAKKSKTVPETAAAMGATAEAAKPPTDIPPPVFSGPPVPGADGQVAVGMTNHTTPFVRILCTYVNFCGIVLALGHAFKPKDRPPVLIPNDWALYCPVTGLVVMSHEKVKGKGKSQEDWLEMAKTAAALSGASDADIAATYKAGIAPKQPAPPLDQITTLIQ